MTTIAALGANGRIARIAEDMLLAHDDIELTLFIHTEDELGADIKDNPRVTVVKGDAKNPDDVLNAINGADEVYANLAATQESSADIIPMAKAVVDMMDKAGIKRLVWISSLGIYNEVPGEFGAWNANILGDYLVNYRKAVDVIEASDLDYTIIRPAWLTDKDEVDFEITEKGELFRGTEVSRKSVASEVVELLLDPDKEVRASIGLDKPGTDGDKPEWYRSASTEHLSE
ncbi:NAD-dependent dehydratase [Bifidobacterium pseudolongum subsp. globosum]|uniref:NAD(P)H-binding protein n=1 Tax=Bifidobacterium pseudolongum TaxID=1694 RepID=UPI0010207747|nr:NAD(P)H-binding protein [Bifidobacterium pseudolongum]RYQ04713.1 NAD-dependent dehydratase [Bifidobacterium pseudolongum subsp. globosum]RYQ09774.1 NAD-dependent dehydratase [Bifidobacterium pseudolongum subsp. globosum]RYQ12938.1 NAD-dependent dehydratase [Bifidobacterium pseudolongum subsp. globosum]RYQ15605.1 NAD-dependent dehydratase [Bifidobacterium pseudolongum subsp. globosum]RYQ60197.1 NAD-dependent dehydratase [Bifidobacterium pseudolongum subsp. globosum]